MLMYGMSWLLQGPGSWSKLYRCDHCRFATTIVPGRRPSRSHELLYLTSLTTQGV